MIRYYIDTIYTNKHNCKNLFIYYSYFQPLMQQNKTFRRVKSFEHLIFDISLSSV